MAPYTIAVHDISLTIPKRHLWLFFLMQPNKWVRLWRKLQPENRQQSLRQVCRSVYIHTEYNQKCKQLSTRLENANHHVDVEIWDLNRTERRQRDDSERRWQVPSAGNEHGGTWQSGKKRKKKNVKGLACRWIDGSWIRGFEGMSARCQGAPALVPDLPHTPFNITAPWICQRERGRRTVNCYFKLSAQICVTQCLVGLLHRRQE